MTLTALVSRAGRIDKVAATLGERGLDQLIVGDLVRPGDTAGDALVNSFWLTGFTGTSALAIVGEDPVFITDIRYAERAERQVSDAFEHVVAASSARLLPELAACLGGRVGYDPRATSVANLGALEAAIAEAGVTVELVEAEGVVEQLRRVKDPGEQAAMAAAARIVDEAFELIVAEGFVGRTELQLAAAIEAHIRAQGVEPLLPTLLAAGENTSMPHAAPSSRVVGPGEPVVIDAGALVEGYHSECTRTFATGEAGEEVRARYALIRRAQDAALAVIRPGVSVREVDEAARAVIREAGLLDRYGAGLGHGVGLAIHEAPRVWPHSDDTLVEGNVISVEPGLWMPGSYGVRIEDLVLVGEEGPRHLNQVPKELRTVSC
ncbi:MAG TPA: Xaa-Pro peptidase family protein [Solirubrobacterales bacterium]|nr:Xaa-Pro peptidase family protein [Solirubrobacterales bacterium]